MDTKGHVGVSLTAYAPVGFWLFRTGDERAALAGGAVVLALATLPDCDNSLSFLDHRGPTHSLLFALLVGLVLGLVAGIAAPGTASRAGSAEFWFATGAFAVLAHLVGDVITPKGVAPFWPLSDRRYSLRITPARDPRANNVLLGVGLLVTAGGMLLFGPTG